MTASFVHLRLHTEFSPVDGLVRVKPRSRLWRLPACRPWPSPT